MNFGVFWLNKTTRDWDTMTRICSHGFQNHFEMPFNSLTNTKIWNTPSTQTRQHVGIGATISWVSLQSHVVIGFCKKNNTIRLWMFKPYFKLLARSNIAIEMLFSSHNLSIATKKLLPTHGHISLPSPDPCHCFDKIASKVRVSAPNNWRRLIRWSHLFGNLESNLFKSGVN